MAKLSGFDPIELPPGFRFHPTDEELITHYLFNKVIDSSFISRAIGEVDLNKVEPWDLPWMAKMGENQWYFFCVRDRKYPTGLRTNRATEAGYWKATGKDKDIFRAITLIGMKKTLVFYTGRAPRGEKTNWVMHEYRLEGKHSMHNLPKTAKNEWVICRVFKKASGEKKVPISGIVSCGPDLQSLDLPSLMDLSSDENQGDKVFDEFSSSSSKNCDFSFTYENSVMLQDQSIMRLVLDNNVSNTSQNGSRVEISEGVCYDEVGFKPYDDQELQMISTAPIELDCLWNY